MTRTSGERLGQFVSLLDDTGQNMVPTVATLAALQAITGTSTSDIRYVDSIGRFKWDGAAWQPIDTIKTVEMFYDDSGEYATALTPTAAYPVRKLGLDTYTTATGITIAEGSVLYGDFSAIPSTGLGSIISYSGSGKAITADGMWTGFDSRRFILFKDFSLNYIGASGDTALWFDFLTRFEIANLYVELSSNADYGMYFRNSYNGKISGGRISGAEVANMIFTIDAADPVFSGQSIIENIDFWDAQNASNNGTGTTVEVPANVMKQLLFQKCHWQSNDIGFSQVDGADVTLVSAHFEANLQRDVQCANGSFNLKILSGFCNNGTTITESMLFDGVGGCLKNFEFLEVNNGANCVTVGANADGLDIENVIMRRASGNTMQGIEVNGDNTTIRNIRAITGGSAATWPVITINAGAKNTRISGLIYENFGAAGAVVDNGGENIIFEDARIIKSPVWAVDGGSQEEGFYMEESGFVNRVWVIYPGGTGAGTTTTAQVGRSTGAGATDYTRYVSHTTPVSAGVYAREQATVSSTPFLSKGDVLLIRTPGTSSTAGSLQVIVEITPYRALT